MFGLPHFKVLGKQSDLPLGGGPLIIYDPVAKTMTFQDDVTIKPKAGKAMSVNLGASASGAVTQITSTSTGVTLSKRAGVITTIAGTLAAGAEETFIVTNTEVAVGDVVAVCIGTYAGAGTPIVYVSAVAAGTFSITVSNLHASAALNAAMTINFVVLKATS